MTLAPRSGAPARPCAICRHLGLEPRSTTNTAGVATAHFDLLEAAEGPVEWHAGQVEVLLPICPEHAVDVYRERVAGVWMTWRVPTS